jgi:8-oxo-dGTP pyrophosphatase MutT (NUDIX family)
MDSDERAAVRESVRQRAEDVLAGVEDRWGDAPRLDPVTFEPFAHHDDSFPGSADAFLDQLFPHAAGCAVVDDDARLLCVRTVVHDRWETPGGAGAPGETLAETAVRETREETGLVPGVTGVLSTRFLEVDLGVPETLPVPFTEFAGRPAGGDVIDGAAVEEHDEVLDVAWLGPDELPECVTAYEQKYEHLTSLADGG